MTFPWDALVYGALGAISFYVGQELLEWHRFGTRLPWKRKR